RAVGRRPGEGVSASTESAGSACCGRATVGRARAVRGCPHGRPPRGPAGATTHSPTQGGPYRGGPVRRLGIPPRIITLFAALAAVCLTFPACAPIAGEVARAVDNSDGATLTYAHQGLAFDPGLTPAVGVIVRAEGGNLQLLEVPDGATCTVT